VPEEHKIGPRIEDSAEVEVKLVPVPSGALPDDWDPDESERETLRKLLAEKSYALDCANQFESGLKLRLASAESELANLRTTAKTAIPLKTHEAATAKLIADWKVFTRSQELNHEQGIAKFKIEAHQARQALELERRARRMEMAQSTFRSSELQKELAETRASLSVTPQPSALRSGSLGLAIVAVCAALIIAGELGFRALLPKQANASSTLAATSTQNSPASSPAPSPSSKVVTPNGFTLGMDRLNSSLAGYHGAAAEAILREVNKKAAGTDPSVCLFLWNDGQPAMIYSSQNHQLSLEGSIGKCADAIDKYR
jgi:hypothetical protein